MTLSARLILHLAQLVFMYCLSVSFVATKQESRLREVSHLHEQAMQYNVEFVKHSQVFIIEQHN